MVEVCQVNIEVAAREFRVLPFVVEDVVAPETLGDVAGDGFDAVAVLAWEG